MLLFSFLRIFHILYLYKNKETLSVSNNEKQLNTFFRILQVPKSNNDSDYIIEEINTHSKLSTTENKKIIFNIPKNKFQFWNFVQINENNLAIKNNYNCYLIVDKLNLFCEHIPLYNATKFKIIRIYSEVEEEKIPINVQLMNQEPIDILIKYIDLRDPNLNRSGIHQIEKDYDNEELRYSIRSILKNIPWIRKIFILMPNEKVRYFKENNLIKKKIVYVKDKDLLGYDSSNPRAFQFRYWKMKKFGISNNIIIMDDDYFIGNKLEKKDFFHIKNGKVIPSIITSDFENIKKSSVQQSLK